MFGMIQKAAIATKIFISAKSVAILFWCQQYAINVVAFIAEDTDVIIWIVEAKIITMTTKQKK